jgi:hypothetical protein
LLHSPQCADLGYPAQGLATRHAGRDSEREKESERERERESVRDERETREMRDAVTPLKHKYDVV